MGIIFDSWLVELGAVLVALFAGIYIYMSLQFQYWKKKGIPYMEPSFPFGNVADMALQRKPIGDTFDAMYWKLSGHKLGGVYLLHQPALLIRDPELVKTVLVKDFVHFHDHGLYFDEETDPLSAHLFFLEGIRWKHLRYKLTPTFTSGKMKMMFPTLVVCGKELKAHLAAMASRKETTEVKDILAKYSTDVIATCAFGIESNCLKNPDSEFRKMGKKSLDPTILGSMRDMMAFLIPKLAEIIKVPRTPRDVTDFFLRIVKETIEYREKFQVSRNDFMQLLIGIKNKKTSNDPIELGEENAEKNMYDVNGMTTEELAAQAFVFFIAGFETSSTTMSFCLYELALNQDIQDRLRDEVDSVMAEHGGEMTYEAVSKMEYLDRIVAGKNHNTGDTESNTSEVDSEMVEHGGEMTYEAVTKMEYLDTIVAETLRKYPPLPALNRICTKEYQLPGSKVAVEVGTPVIIPVHALHHDPQYYPNPEVFDPERFTEEAKNQRHPYVYLPFGEGPRICIGSRFGLMQTKVGLASVVSGYQLNVCKKLTAIPLVMEPKSFIMAAKGGINLQITERVKASM